MFKFFSVIHICTYMYHPEFFLHQRPIIKTELHLFALKRRRTHPVSMTKKDVVE